MNSLGIDLTGKTVILRRDIFSEKEKYDDINNRKLLCRSGFGCEPFTMDGCIYATYVPTGQEIRIDGYDVESLICGDCGGIMSNGGNVYYCSNEKCKSYDAKILA
jgi:hypothetical protein